MIAWVGEPNYGDDLMPFHVSVFPFDGCDITSASITTLILASIRSRNDLATWVGFHARCAHALLSARFLTAARLMVLLIVLFLVVAATIHAVDFVKCLFRNVRKGFDLPLVAIASKHVNAGNITREDDAVHFAFAAVPARHSGCV
jgi:hypothetical protein